jgi:hypothetical protein
MMREAGNATDLFYVNSIFAQPIAEDFIAYGTCLKMKFTFFLYEWNAPFVLSFGSQVLRVTILTGRCFVCLGEILLYVLHEY